MKQIILALGLLGTLYNPVLAQGVPNSATVVNACGTPPSTYTPGQNKPILQNTNGLGCVIVDSSALPTGGATATNQTNVQSAPGTPQTTAITIQGNASGIPFPPLIGITPTDRTITSASGASQTVMAANTSRHSLTILNTGTANCGVNPTGGTAVIGGAGTLTLFPGGSYAPRIPTLSAVTAICTSTQPLYANEN